MAEERTTADGALSPEEWHDAFLRQHEERMRRVDEALEEARRSADGPARSERSAAA